MASLSTFIGVDGTNTTMNSGRVSINLKPLSEPGDQRHRGYPAAAAQAGGTSGHHAVHAAGAGPHRGGPGQPDAVPYSLEDPNSQELNEWTRKLVAALQKLRSSVT